MRRVTALLCCLLTPVAVSASDGEWDPWQSNPAAGRKPPIPDAPSAESWALLWAVRGYQLFVSPADGAGCSYYPTCSAYSMQALRKHGPLVGFTMTADRVNRNHSNQDGYYPQIRKFGRVYLYDPVANNDFWFGASRRSGLNLFAHPHVPTEIFWDRY
jgi:putative membrane protein insertion efficiency factor